jgi:hypothetical protein
LFFHFSHCRLVASGKSPFQPVPNDLLVLGLQKWRAANLTSRFDSSVFFGLGFASTDKGPSNIQEFCNLDLWEFCEKRQSWVEKDQSVTFAFWYVTVEEHIANCCNYVFMIEPWQRFQMKMLADECVLCLTNSYRFA